MPTGAVPLNKLSNAVPAVLDLVADPPTSKLPLESIRIRSARVPLTLVWKLRAPTPLDSYKFPIYDSELVPPRKYIPAPVPAVVLALAIFSPHDVLASKPALATVVLLVLVALIYPVTVNPDNVPTDVKLEAVTPLPNVVEFNTLVPLM